VSNDQLIEQPDDSTAAKAAPESEIIVSEPVKVVPPDAAFLDMGGLKVYRRNDLVEGTIVQVLDDQIIVDIGTKTEGIIPREEVELGPNPDMSQFAVGDTIKAVVVKEEDEEKPYYLSKRKADQFLVWDKVDESFKEGTRIDAVGFRAVKGGLLVDIGTIAFLPQSLLDIRRIDDLESMVGQKLEVKVVEYDREAQPHPKIIVSRRAVLEEDLTYERDKLYDNVDVGKIVDGKVVKLTNYGAFIELGGVQGLLHISEMSLGRIRHPNEVMKEGDTIQVKILKIDKKRKRISLGRRELLPNPWEVIGEKYRPGMVVQGVVVRTADFGAFIKLDDYFEGLAHISELVDNKISHAKEVFNPGDKVNVLIMAIDKRAKRVKLSVRRAADAQRKTEVDAFMKSQGDLANVFGERLREAMAGSEIELVRAKEAEVQVQEQPPEVPEPEIQADAEA
jgi:4-hydroxy-3-methylbut-2-enyl diphosphate reductase